MADYLAGSLNTVGKGRRILRNFIFHGGCKIIRIFNSGCFQDSKLTTEVTKKSFNANFVLMISDCRGKIQLTNACIGKHVVWRMKISGLFTSSLYSPS